MKKRRAAGSAYLASSVVTKHVLALMWDTFRGLRFAAEGGGLIGGVMYADHPMTDVDAKVFDRKLADCMKWLDAALRDVGVTPASCRMGPKEQELINHKIRIVNRWANARKIRQWTEMVITLAALNLCLFWCRMRKRDTAAMRTLFVKADDLCLRLGGGEDVQVVVLFQIRTHDLGIPRMGHTKRVVKSADERMKPREQRVLKHAA